VNPALARGYQKRGGGAQRVTLNEGLAISGEMPPDLVALDEALTVLAASEPRKADVVELRFFGGRSVEETAEALHVSAVTVMRDYVSLGLLLVLATTRAREATLAGGVAPAWLLLHAGGREGRAHSTSGVEGHHQRSDEGHRPRAGDVRRAVALRFDRQRHRP